MVYDKNIKKTIVSIKCAVLDEETASWLIENKPFGIILFKENIVNFTQLKKLISDVKSLYSPAPVFSVDFEGGKVNRLAPITGKLKIPLKQNSLRDFGNYSGELLKSLGIDINFAPVVDIDFGAKGNGLDLRYFGSTVGQIVENAGQYLEGLESCGVQGCLKHYPGLGKVIPDTHYSLSEINSIDDIEEAPFKQLSTENRLIMVAHVFVKDFNQLSTYSEKLVSRIKKFHIGLLITDDLSMKALSEKNDMEKISKSLKSGFDLALIRFENPIFKDNKNT